MAKSSARASNPQGRKSGARSIVRPSAGELKPQTRKSGVRQSARELKAQAHKSDARCTDSPSAKALQAHGRKSGARSTDRPEAGSSADLRCRRQGFGADGARSRSRPDGAKPGRGVASRSRSLRRGCGRGALGADRSRADAASSRGPGLGRGRGKKLLADPISACVGSVPLAPATGVAFDTALCADADGADAGGSATKQDLSLASLKLLHITKCAGTALEEWGLKQGCRWGRRWPAVKAAVAQQGGLRPPHENKLRSEWWHVPPRFFQKNPYEGFHAFAVVRCPYGRAISEFRCPWKGFLAPVRRTDEDRRRKRLAATADDLNRWLEEKLSAGVCRPPFRNGHWIPQHFYLWDEVGRPCVEPSNILRLEELNACFSALLRRFGLSSAPPLLAQNESEMPRFSPADLHAGTRALIESCYAEDFERLGYPRI